MSSPRCPHAQTLATPLILYKYSVEVKIAVVIEKHYKTVQVVRVTRVNVSASYRYTFFMNTDLL